MPRIAELREIDGAIWARLEMVTHADSITLWTQNEIEEERKQAVKNFLITLFEYHIGDW